MLCKTVIGKLYSRYASWLQSSSVVNKHCVAHIIYMPGSLWAWRYHNHGWPSVRCYSGAVADTSLGSLEMLPLHCNMKPPSHIRSIACQNLIIDYQVTHTEFTSLPWYTRGERVYDLWILTDAVLDIWFYFPLNENISPLSGFVTWL